MIIALLLATAASDVSFTAKMPRAKFTVGEEYEIALEVDMSDEINPHFMWEEGFEASGARRPILLVEAPKCIELIGTVPDPLETPGDFQRSFLHYPYGRRLLAASETLRFKLVSKPSGSDRIGLNLIAYPGSLGTDTSDDSSFVRLRANLAVRSGVRAKSSPSKESAWGPAESVKIGDEAPDFDLPKADGSRLKLSDFRGEQNVLLIMYRRET